MTDAKLKGGDDKIIPVMKTMKVMEITEMIYRVWFHDHCWGFSERCS